VGFEFCQRSADHVPLQPEEAVAFHAWKDDDFDLPDAEAGGKPLHLPLSMCPSIGNITQRKLRLVENVLQ
jgi:hypothetical protein